MLSAMLVTLGLLGLLAIAFALRPATSTDAQLLIDRVDALLPQTQCGRCEFTGCRPYAEALVRGEADIDHCPPGGEATARALAQLLDREARPVNPRYGITPDRPIVAWIDESTCIGCTKCIQACPVDAIVGASRYMHTIIADACTGCELCIPPCPVDCIELRPAARVVPLHAAAHAGIVS